MARTTALAHGSYELSQQDKNRFELEWVLPLEPGLETHVMLYDLEKHPPDVVAVGHGANEAAALLELWTTLTGRSEAADALAVVTDAYVRRTGGQPDGTPIG